MRPTISLGDAVQAFVELGAQDDEAREAIVKCLGLRGGEAPSARVRSLGAWKATSTEEITAVQRRAEAQHATTPATATLPAPGSEPPSGSVPTLATSVRKVRTGTGTLQPPAWATRPGEILDPEAGAGPACAQLPLFGRLWHRGLLAAALATSSSEGEVDLDRIVEILAEDRPLTRLPRTSAPTLRRGAQLLLDRAAGLDPFVPDQSILLRQLDSILADDRLQVLHFVGCPGRGVDGGPQWPFGPWRPPPPGTPVLAVTDVGIGGSALDPERATAAEWLQFAQQVRASGCRLLALVPYEARRWPAGLLGVMTLIHWSERTTVRHIRRALRDARYRLA